PSSTAQSGVAFAQQPVVQLRDGDGNAVKQEGVTLAGAIATGGGSVRRTLTATTTAGGTASFTNLSISGTTGDRTLSFSATGLTQIGRASCRESAEAAAQLTPANQPAATAQSGVAVAQPLVVPAREGDGNPV